MAVGRGPALHRQVLGSADLGPAPALRAHRRGSHLSKKFSGFREFLYRKLSFRELFFSATR
jgi:hypothetical protein